MTCTGEPSVRRRCGPRRRTTPARPVLVTEEAEQYLEEPEVAEDLGLDAEQAKALRTGELDMGLVNYRNP
ncbi:hypothetical protein B7755_006510 [Streptomyces sp. NBS 14/10]|uniref:hypothetical protein n=1 Tax=Streptomyces sp. NBS 14/10 TaxID=1945643 RepID=UPI001C529C17|nr:hypothetical protein [Streptomyces sp. NBS 14/10]KAK1177854.1 hypothetical protein B7755_006510 [Streptomyces sp. NBS 14/10]